MTKAVNIEYIKKSTNERANKINILSKFNMIC